MLEVHIEDGVFVLFDTDESQPVMRFDKQRDADQLIAELQVRELHSALERWFPDRMQAVS